MTFRENPVEMTCQRPHIMVDMEGRVRALIEKVNFNSHSVAYTIAIVLYSFHGSLRCFVRSLQQPGHLHLRDH